MRREDARTLARTLMDHHGLTGWAFRFDRARRRAGSCSHSTRTHARLTACLAGLVAGVAVLVHQAVESGRAQEWVDHPRELLVATRLLLNEGVAPMRVSGALEDLVLLACLMGAWISVLLVTGMDAQLLSGLVPVLVLLVPVAVTSQGVPLPLVWGAAVGIGLLLWVGAPRPGGWAPPVAVGLVLAVSAGVISLLPAAGNRAWNTSAITLGPVSPNVPDVTVALGEDLQSLSPEAFPHLWFGEDCWRGASELAPKDPVGQWVRMTWDVLVTLDEFALHRTSADQRFEGSLLDYLGGGAPAGAHLIPKGRFRPSESETVRGRKDWMQERRFRVPEAVNPSGIEEMLTHVAIQTKGSVSPRLYLDDRTSDLGVVVVGYIGPHLTNTKTS